jgi:plasmid stabilization system protein ParE
LQELEAADDWYLQRSLDASAAFIGSALDAFDKISQAPHRWPKYLHGTRRLVLDRFPFSIV